MKRAFVAIAPHRRGFPKRKFAPAEASASGKAAPPEEPKQPVLAILIHAGPKPPADEEKPVEKEEKSAKPKDAYWAGGQVADRRAGGGGLSGKVYGAGDSLGPSAPELKRTENNAPPAPRPIDWRQIVQDNLQPGNPLGSLAAMGGAALGQYIRKRRDRNALERDATAPVEGGIAGGIPEGAFATPDMLSPAAGPDDDLYGGLVYAEGGKVDSQNYSRGRRSYGAPTASMGAAVPAPQMPGPAMGGMGPMAGPPAGPPPMAMPPGPPPQGPPPGAMGGMMGAAAGMAGPPQGPPPGAMGGFGPPPGPPPGGGSLQGLPQGADPRAALMAAQAQLGAAPPAQPQGPPPDQQAALRAALAQRAAVSPVMGFAKGGAVATEDKKGQTPSVKARRDRQWGDVGKAAEDLPPVEAHAKGGAIKRRRATDKKKSDKPAKKPPVPMVTDEDMGAPPVNPLTAAPPPAGPPVAPPPAAAPPMMAKGGKCVADKDNDKMAEGGECKKMAAGGVAKVRHGFPKTNAKPKKMATGGSVRGCGAATKGKGFSGIY